jgi:hypothetical protein
MNDTTAPLHSVHFYESHESLIDRLCGIVCSGLLVGNSVLIVATQEHREQLIAALFKLEVDVRDYSGENQLAMFDAEELLSTFMVDDKPDSELFLASVGSILSDIGYGSNEDRGVVIFGEMVTVLWKEGNPSGALALECLWNDLLTERAFQLHCAYPRALFGKNDAGIFNICESHSHVVGAITHTPAGPIN